MAVPTTVAVGRASLYVGDLHPDVTDGQLFDAFSDVKNLDSVRVCRDSLSGRSLGYGYVNFVATQDAIRAMEEKNNTPLNGKVIRIMWSHRDPDARKSGIGNLFVKNLDDSIDNVRLHEIFSKFGNIVSCKVVVSEDGKNKGFGFVQFESDESANAAIEKVNGSIIGGKQIYVGNFVKNSERVLHSPDAKYTNLYIKNLDQDVTEELLQEKFSEFGKIAKVVISKDNNGTSRGFGFVNFENSDDAKQATEIMNGAQLGSKFLYAARAQKKAEREQILHRQFEERRKENIQKNEGSNVYVKNIDDDVNDDELREHFSQCGTITSAKLMRDEKGISKGFGFVCFSTPEEANKAIAILHGFMFHRKPLYVAIAQKKESRQAQLRLWYEQRMAGVPRPPTTVIPTGHPPLCYTPPPGVVSQIPLRHGLIYPPLGLGPGWGANGFAPPSRPTFQPAPLSMAPNTPGHYRQNGNRMNGNMLRQGVRYSVPFMSHLRRPTQLVTSPKDSSNQQRAGQAKFMRNGRPRVMKNGSAVQSAASNSVGTTSQSLNTLTSMLSAASPNKQKQMLGERLYPLVKKHRNDLARKITGMLLEMDNSELLLLLESPKSLAAKVEEAVQILKLSKTIVAGQDALHPNYLSAEVAVN